MNIPKIPIGEILVIGNKTYLGTINGNKEITEKDKSFFEYENTTSPKKEFVAVKESDVDGINYFSSNIGSPKEVIEKNASGEGVYKKTYFYYEKGGGYTKLYYYNTVTQKWVENNGL